MSGRQMWVHAIEGCNEMQAQAFTVSLQEEGVANVEVHEKFHTPESWAELSAEIARAIEIVCGPCIEGEAK